MREETKKMSCRRLPLKRLAAGLFGVLLGAAAGCNGGALERERVIGAEIIVLQLPEGLGALRRPAVEFNHVLHTKALEPEGCKPCHDRVDEKGRMIPEVVREEGADREALMERYHDRCLGCHKQRVKQGKRTGPRTCGECHVRRAPYLSARVAMAFDYTLHYRHVKATKEKCETCHHVYNEATRKLEYKKGQEDACRDCHLEQDGKGKLYSLANAAHRDCLKCHMDRREKKQESGPVECRDCHGQQRKWEAEQKKKYPTVPRLKRGQPDNAWIFADGAKTQVVAFNHKNHEPQTRTCSTCHHKTLKACKKCHTLTGSKDGGQVILEKAYHLATSDHSCVGCHHTKADAPDCAGCHRKLGQPPAERACVICHNGPRMATKATTIAAPFPAETPLGPLPKPSDDLPDKVVISALAKEYKAAELPHRKIVDKLDAIVRKSKLASRFHGQPEVLCAGCHHHSPIGKRPAPCRACHAATAHVTQDKPDLKTAYHRQCVGCHQEMRITKALGCTACHKKAAAEVTR